MVNIYRHGATIQSEEVEPKPCTHKRQRRIIDVFNKKKGQIGKWCKDCGAIKLFEDRVWDIPLNRYRWKDIPLPKEIKSNVGAMPCNLYGYDEMFKILTLIDAEFRSDPMSVQCFDSSVVARTERIVRLLKLAHS